MSERQAASPPLFKAILTDIHFWVPMLVLAGGVLVLVLIHGD